MKLTDIRIYPIKSLAGIQLNESPVTSFGLKSDRMMMLIDEQGVFLSQRKYPRMALLNTLWLNDSLKVSTFERSDLIIHPDNFSADAIQVNVWGDPCYGYVADEFINRWFSEFLECTTRLVSYQAQKQRACDPKFSKAGDVVSFADGFPLLLISEASLNDLNQRLENPVSMTSFRPNLVVSGCEPYAEDSWSKIRIGGVEFAAVKPCSRCVLTTVDPTTGVKRSDGEPLRTLSHYRRAPGGVMFGMNLIPRSTGLIRLADPLEIIR